MPKVAFVVGARPNFVKVAALLKAARALPGLETVLVHTGQHYDRNMSSLFLDELGIAEPDFNLGVGAGSHAEQLAGVMTGMEPLIASERFDMAVVVGDVNSTIATALVASRYGVPVAHVEAGLRSFDRRMPEEVNRILTDAIASLHFVTEQSGVDNLRREGVDESRIHLVGNVMIDTLAANLDRARGRAVLPDLALEGVDFCLATVHRPSNVDSMEAVRRTVDCLAAAAEAYPLVLPLHPRTRKRLDEFGLIDALPGDRIRLTEPKGYLDFLCLMASARIVLTDSGGIQEETTFLGIPCLTLRENTERPVTVEMGTNTLVGTDLAKIRSEVRRVTEGSYKKGGVPPLWDGHAAERIMAIILDEI